MSKKGVSEDELVEFLTAKTRFKVEKSVARPEVTSKKQDGFQGIEEGMEERTAWVSLGASGGEEGVFLHAFKLNGLLTECVPGSSTSTTPEPLYNSASKP